MTERVGFIGLGIMGSRMAANVRRAGFPLTVWNRTAETARAWAERNDADLAATPAELAEKSDLVVTMVVDGPQVEGVLLGEEGVAAGAADGLLCVDMSTIGPSAARRIGEALASRRIGFVDAPVTGSAPKAEDGTLTIMAGGDAADVARATPLLESMGRVVLHVGPLGDGQMVKLVNNAVAAVNTGAVAEALALAERVGLDRDALVAVMAAGSGASAMLELKARPMLERDYTTLFKLGHMLKDVTLCLEEARAAGAELDLVETVRGLLAAAGDRGLGEQDFAALAEALRPPEA